MEQEECRCPPKPHWPPGSATETAEHERWERDHGHHPNANGGAGFLTLLQMARVRLADAQEDVRRMQAQIVVMQRNVAELEREERAANFTPNATVTKTMYNAGPMMPGGITAFAREGDRVQVAPGDFESMCVLTRSDGQRRDVPRDYIRMDGET